MPKPDTSASLADETTTAEIPAPEPTMAEAIEDKLAGNEPAEPVTEPAKPEDTPAPVTEPAKPEPVKATEAPAAVAPADDDPYAVPEGLTRKSRERFSRLTDIAKSAEAELAQVTGKNAEYGKAIEGFNQALEESQCSPDDFKALLDYNYRVKTGDLQGALAILDDSRAKIAQALGREVPGVDLLADFPDLKAGVEEMQIDKQHAIEIAHARRIRAEQQAGFQEQQQYQQSEQQFNASKQQAVQAVSDFEREMLGKDIDAQAKLTVIAQHLPEIASTYPPAQWAAQVKLMYSVIGKAAPAAPTPQNRNPSPLRPMGGGGQRQPSSMLDAIENNLDGG